MYELNLLPSHLQSRRNYFGQKVKIVKLLIIMFAFLITGLYCGFLYQYHNLQKKDTRLKAILQRQYNKLQQAEKINQVAPKDPGMLKAAASLVNSRPVWSELLADLDLNRFPGLSFTQLKMYRQNELFKIELCGEADTTGSVVKLYQELTQKNYLKEVKLQSVRHKENSKWYIYVIAAVLRENYHG